VKATSRKSRSQSANLGTRLFKLTPMNTVKPFYKQYIVC
jgi:hypothetical protein